MHFGDASFFNNYNHKTINGFLWPLFKICVSFVFHQHLYKLHFQNFVNIYIHFERAKHCPENLIHINIKSG